VKEKKPLGQQLGIKISREKLRERERGAREENENYNVRHVEELVM